MSPDQKDAGYWHQATPEPDLPPGGMNPAPRISTDGALSASIETDVLIIGAGYTGLSTALHCRELGLEVCMLEATTPGFGASGRNAGQWLPGWVGRTPSQVPNRLNVFNVECARLVPELAQRHGIHCDLRPTGVLQVAAEQKALRKLHDLAAQWQQCGTSVSVLNGDELRKHVITSQYLGGILFHDAGCLNPLAYARGLARAAAGAGARIYCHSPALELQRAGGQWEARTPMGKARAGRVVIATDAFSSPSLWPRLHESFYRLSIPMLASTVLPIGGRDFLPRGTPFAELRPGGLLFGGMLDASRRWIVSTAPWAGSMDRDAIGAWAMGRFRRVFPQVAPFQWETLWWGELGISQDTLPRIYALAPGVHAINGYSGGGIALASGLGRAMARMLAGGEVRELPVAPVPLGAVPLRRLIPAILRNVAMPLARVLDGFRS